MHKDILDAEWDGDREALLGVVLLDLEHPTAYRLLSLLDDRGVGEWWGGSVAIVLMYSCVSIQVKMGYAGTSIFFYVAFLLLLMIQAAMRLTF